MNLHQVNRILVPALLCAGMVLPTFAADRLDLRYESLELPAAPSVTVPADLDGDGVQDLVVVLAYSEWDRITVDEQTRMEGIDHLVTMLTVVPTLVDHRELHVFFGMPDGGYERRVPPLQLDLSVLSVGAGPSGMPVVAVTDDGLSQVVLQEGGLVLRPVIVSRPVIAYSGALVPELVRTPDIDGDGLGDLLFPALEGIAVHLAGEEGLQASPASVVPVPGEALVYGDADLRTYPQPEIRDVNGDGLVDLLVSDRRNGWDRFLLYPNLGGGRFGDAVRPHDHSGEEDTAVVHFGDLDGDGVAEYVTQEDLEVPGDGMRSGMREAKRPPKRFRLHRTGSGQEFEPEPYHRFDTIGYAFDVEDDGEEEIGLPGGLQDLDGDGRQDLVSLTLEFSLMQVVRILATQSLKIGLDFHVWCQDGEGQFHAVEGLDLSGKFKINLKNFRLGQLSQFGGDFDGDGRADFLQVGRGRTASIHLGREGCFYPPEADFKLRMVEAPHDLTLLRVGDLDGDGRSDVMIIQPQEPDPKREKPPVRLDLYLSGGAS